jgi:hypothetical protein
MTKNCLEIEVVLMFESLEACKGKKATFGWLGHGLKNHQFSNFQFHGRKIFFCLEL